MNKVIFLTGATGFVGRNLIEKVLKEDATSRMVLLIFMPRRKQALWVLFDFFRGSLRRQINQFVPVLNRGSVTEEVPHRGPERLQTALYAGY